MADESPPRKPIGHSHSADRGPRQIRRPDRALGGGEECFLLAKNGQPVAALIDIDEFEDYLELNDPEVIEAIAEGRQEYLAGKSRPAESCSASSRRNRSASAS